jgi:putative phage-type endonuclease
VAANPWECPDAELLLPANAPRDAWLAARRNGVGSSELAALFGEAKYGVTEFSVWLDKVNGRPDSEPTEAMDWGTRLEDAIAERFADDYGVGVLKAGLMRSKRAPHLLASVDRLTDDGGGLECKNHAWYMRREYFQGDREIIPRAFYWQMVGCIAVTGRPHWWLAANIGGQYLLVRRLDRADCQADVDRALEVVETWWPRHVYANIPPDAGQPADIDPDPRSTVEATLPGLVRADKLRWHELLAEQRAVKAELAEIKDRMRLQLGTAKVLTVNGVPQVEMRTRRGNLVTDWGGLEVALPGAKARYTSRKRSTTYPVLIGDEDDDHA